MNHSTDPILPGGTIGVLGSGQLGRMLTIAARRMGYRVHVFSPEADSPTGQVADLEHVAAYDDLGAVETFAKLVDVVTFEFENVPAETAAACLKHAPVRPDHRVLHTTQNRLREKSMLSEAGFPVTPFRKVTTAGELHAAVGELGIPGVLKTAGWGYDGKGQRVISDESDLAGVFAELDTVEAIYEKFITFEKEVSVVISRGAAGDIADFGVVENTHVNHILDLTVSPADVSDTVRDRATEIARGVMETLDVVGTLCVEFFVTSGAELMINELAPRPHNSGHFTVDACTSCQFEQQLRAVCGLALGSTQQPRPAAMVNLLGDLWTYDDFENAIAAPNWQAALAHGEVKLHLYGKHEPRPGRKMGHLTALADTPTDAARIALAARLALTANLAG